ncbi:MAG: hypothetical protein GY715_09340 [Planctomycetes bacterium]|nr:hypothetical protein [Planctomycetota bacterium]
MIMIRGGEPVVLCIDLSGPNVRRHRRLLTTLAAGSSGAVRTVGLLGRDGLTRRCAEVGCDLYVADGEDAVDLVRTLHGNPSQETATRGPRAGVVARLGGCVRTVEIPADPAGPVSAN